MLAIVSNLALYAGIYDASAQGLAELSQNITTQSDDGYTAGSIAPGAATGGVISKLYVTAPPNYAFEIEKDPGSFVNCGEGSENHSADHNGRQTTVLVCGVTITETLVIPAAARSARLVVHF